MKRITLILGALLLGLQLNAQSRLAYTEFGIAVGSMNYSGDIATTTSMGALIEEARPNFTILGKRHLNDWFSFGLQASYGWIYANDLNHTFQNRGLEVTTSVFQLNPFIEIGLIKFGKFHFDNKFSIYIKAGGGLVAYNPEITASKVVPPGYELQPYAYESFNYFVAPGMKFRIGYKSILSLEATFHNSGADNMDGIRSTDALNTSANDTYGGVNLVFSTMIF